MNDGQWTQEEHAAHLCIRQHKLTNLYVWNREARAEAERHNREFGESMANWRTRLQSTSSGTSWSTSRMFPLCVCFQMSMKLIVDMIPPRLQLHTGPFQRKPLQQHAEVGQQGSTQKMSLQGLVLSQSSQLHLRSFQDLLQPRQHIHLVHLSKPFPNQSNNLPKQLHWSIPYLNQLSRVRPISRCDTRHFHGISRHHLQLICWM